MVVLWDPFDPSTHEIEVPEIEALKAQIIQLDSTIEMLPKDAAQGLIDLREQVQQDIERIRNG